MTFDGKGTFHGMGMITTVTPGVQFRYSVTRKKITNLNTTSQSKIPFEDYALCQRMRRKIEFRSIASLSAGCAHVDIL